MTRRTEELIRQLAQDVEPVHPARPVGLMLRWLIAALLYIAAFVLLFGLRADIDVLLRSPLFMAEIGLLLALTVTTGLAASALSFPDYYQKRWMIAWPAIPLALFVGLLMHNHMRQGIAPLTEMHGMECLIVLLVVSILPAAAIFCQLRRQASIHYYLTGGIALLASYSLACLGLRLSEETNDVTHLLLWHYLPMIGVGVFGMLLGRIWLRW